MDSKLSFGIDIALKDVWYLTKNVYTIIRGHRNRRALTEICSTKSLLLVLLLIATMRLRLMRKAASINEAATQTSTPSRSDSDIAGSLIRFSRPSHRPPHRRPRRNSMLQTPIYLNGNEDRWDSEGVTDIALKMGGVATFIKEQSCTGLQAESLPTRTMLKDLVDRLLNYGWPLVSAGNLNKLDLSGEENILEPKDAAQTMEQLADFFDLRARDLREIRLDVSRERKIAKDLRFAAKYTEELLKCLEDKDKENEARPVEEIEAPMSQLIIENGNPDLLFADEILAPTCTNLDEYSPQTDSSEGNILSDMPLCPEPTIKNSQSRRVKNNPWRPAVSDVDELPLSDQNCRTDTSSTPSELPSDAITTPVVEIPSELKGRRHISRVWFESDSRFSELLGDVKQWQDQDPDYEFTTIRGRRDLEDLAHHFCDASPLGISALFIIKCEHPLDPEIVSFLDVDILRFVRLVLWDWISGHPEREAERESLEVVRREIKARKEEMTRLEDEHDFDWRPSTAVNNEQRTYTAPPESSDDEFWHDASSSQRIASETWCSSGIRPLSTNFEPEKEIKLSPQWLNASDDVPEYDDDLTIGIAKTQTFTPVTMPTECIIPSPKGLGGLRKPLKPDTDDFTTLIRRSTLAALGVEVDSAGVPIVIPPRTASASAIARNAHLQTDNDILRHKVAALEAEIENLRPACTLPTGSGTDEPYTHPLQEPVGELAGRPTSRSAYAQVDSCSGEIPVTDDDLKRYARNDMLSLSEFLRTEPSLASPTSSEESFLDRWLASLGGTKKKKATTAPKHRPLVYEGKPGIPERYTPTSFPRHSKGKGRANA